MLKPKLVIAIIIVLLATASLIAFPYFRNDQAHDTVSVNSETYVGAVETTAVRTGYLEHAFDLPSNQDIYTRLTLEKIVKSGKSLVGDATPIALPEWKYVQHNPEISTGEMWQVNNDTYEFIPASDMEDGRTQYSVFKNKTRLFTHPATYLTQSPFVQKAIINNTPAFTIQTACHEDRPGCDYDIYYDGKFITTSEQSEAISINNPHFPIQYDNKIGYINYDASGKVSFVFNGQNITDGFDQIHFENYGSVSHIFPTVYENGVLIFYAKRQNQNYIVEVDLSSL